MAKNPDIEKFCKNCGVKVERKYINGRIEDYAKYLAREHCSRTCYTAMRKKKAAMPEPTKAEIQMRIIKDLAKSEVIEDLTPLEFLTREMNRPSNSLSYRKECAALAAPYVHQKLDAKTTGKTKKEEQKEAAGNVAASGRFAPTAPPKTIVN